MKKMICQICKVRSAINYDGRWICVYCWPKHANEVDDPVGATVATSSSSYFRVIRPE